MLIHFIKITLRNFIKNRIFVFINILGMGIALACCILAYVNYGYFGRYDGTHVNAEKIYRINFNKETEGDTKKYGISPLPLKDAISDEITGLNNVVRYRSDVSSIKVKDEVFATSVAYVDKEFVKLFTIPLVAGSYEGGMDKSKIFISEKLALKYFGNTNPLGKTLQQVTDDLHNDYTVEGVFKEWTKNSSFQFEAFVPFDNIFEISENIRENDWADFCVVFCKVNDESKINEIEKHLNKYVQIQNRARKDLQITRFYLDPFVGLASRDQRLGVTNSWLMGSPPASVVSVPIVMAALILFIACFNFTNTSIAVFSKRLKEIGIRKVMGSRRKTIIIQFLGETFFFCFLSLIVALVMAKFLIIWYNDLWTFLHLEINYVDNPEIIIFLLILLTISGLLSGGYPAFYISKFEPTGILKGTLRFGGNNIFVRILLTLQFTLSLIAIVFAVAFVNNAEFQKNMDMGYDMDGIIYLKVSSADDYNNYRNKLLQNKSIQMIVGTKGHIFYSVASIPVKFESVTKDVKLIDAGENYVDAMELQIIQGRDFIEKSESDRAEAILINEEFARAFGMQEPLGKQIFLMDSARCYVVGVVKNFYLDGIWRPIEPLVIRQVPEEEYTHLIVKTSPEKLSEVNAQMEIEWKNLFPSRLYSGKLQNDLRSFIEETNINVIKIFSFMGLLATLLSLTGLFSLVTLSIIKKMKEIGVRKILGATIPNIILVINKDFIIILSVSSILGMVSGYLMIDSIMSSSWAYYQKASFSVFVYSVAFIFITSAIVIIGKTFSAAMSNPSEALRNE